MHANISMSLIGQVWIKDEVAHDSDDMLAAFDEGTNVIEVAKFRNKGSLVGSFAKLWFESESNRLKNELAENVIYNWNPPHIETDLPFDEPNEDEVCPF